MHTSASGSRIYTARRRTRRDPTEAHGPLPKPIADEETTLREQVAELERNADPEVVYEAVLTYWEEYSRELGAGATEYEATILALRARIAALGGAALAAAATPEVAIPPATSGPLSWVPGSSPFGDFPESPLARARRLMLQAAQVGKFIEFDVLSAEIERGKRLALDPDNRAAANAALGELMEAL